MEKTYKFVKHTEPLTRPQIKALYDGYWVFIVNARFTETKGFIDGIPAVVGEIPFDGVEDGIYDKYDKPEYGIQYGMVLTQNPFLVSLINKERGVAV